ncbi:glycosyltransferase family A protein [Mesonia sp. K7]|uniref:glycosyltransferase family 2 protein n=1 Tax=Mesonia sp. K7 TaxID=2218606 RepID=UPI000DA7653D|nr:glycosyltransferase family A protein [Mesonia sp. K7]PZD77170.1 glycosyltransferase family 2 protein [Mesonia sp. K7]
MKINIIITAHNEEQNIAKTLQSLVHQTFLPNKVVVVNDNSTDKTGEIIQEYVSNYDFISVVNSISSEYHQPGSKIIQAFYKGYETLDQSYDLIGKFDADIILPKNYFEKLIDEFQNNPKIGIAAGNLYIKEHGNWIYENISEKTKPRGPIKLYSKKCFKYIGGLKPSIGWDTADELLARYHGFEVKVLPELYVKHLRPTGQSYAKKSNQKQGEAFYKLRYGFLITTIASLKLALKKKKPQLFIDYIQGYFQAKKENLPFLVNEEEGKWIRSYRWKMIKQKLF